jgi:glutamyl-tRNA synthetase
VRPFLVADADLVIEDEARSGLPENAAEVLDAGITALAGLKTGTGLLPEERAGQWTAETIEATLRSALIEGLGLKPRVAFAPLRVAVSGAKVSPPLFESMQILGQAATLARLRALRASL